MKLASKYAASQPIALSVFESNARSLDCELQQRAVEYITMLNSFSEIAAFSYAEMPPMVAVHDDGKAPAMPAMMISDSTSTTTTVASPKRQVIDDLFGDGSQPTDYSNGNNSAGGAPRATLADDLLVRHLQPCPVRHQWTAATWRAGAELLVRPNSRRCRPAWSFNGTRRGLTLWAPSPAVVTNPSPPPAAAPPRR